jgi:hypothetical protein
MLRGYVRRWDRDRSPSHAGREARSTNRVAPQTHVAAIPRTFNSLRSCINNLSRRLPSPKRVSSAVRFRLAALASDRSGNVAVVTALALPVLIGAAGLGVETSYWYLTQRSMQNAADSAAVAAATIGDPNFEAEAKAVASAYGYEHGKGNLSVSVSKAAACPAGGNDCYSVAITGYVPLFLSRIVGYDGNASVSSVQSGKTITTRQTQLSATAVARQVSTLRRYCVLALGANGAKFDILVNGGSKSELNNCGIMSNDTMRCNGSGGIADYADSPEGDPTQCGRVAHTRPVPKVADPYTSLASNIPASTCGSYAGVSWAADANKVLPATYSVCGNLKLTGNVNITSSSVIVIYNGGLELGDYKLSGSSLTIVFAGQNGGYSHTLIGKNGDKGSLEITAPTTGVWAGVALYQDPSLTTGVDVSDAGNSPTLDVTGLLYFPHASVTVKGAVNKNRTTSCFVLVVDSLEVDGTGYLLSDGSQCAKDGLQLPSVVRGQLVG